MRIFDLRYLILFLSLLGACPVLAAPSSLPIAPFKARYTIYAWGLPMGESIVTLTEIATGRYRMHAKAHAIGIATVLVPDPLTIQVEGYWRETALTPLHYRYHWGREQEPADTRLEFDWQRGIVETHNEDQQLTLLLTERVVDPLSLQLLAMWDLHRGYRPQQYTTVIDNELETYQIKLEGQETLPTGLGDLHTLRFSSRKPGKNRVTILWFAPSLDYLLVQAVQTKKGSEKFKIIIDQVTRID